MVIKILDRRPIRYGDSYFFPIPKQFIDNEVVKPRLHYDLSFTEVVKKKKKE